MATTDTPGHAGIMRQTDGRIINTGRDRIANSPAVMAGITGGVRTDTHGADAMTLGDSLTTAAVGITMPIDTTDCIIRGMAMADAHTDTRAPSILRRDITVDTAISVVVNLPGAIHITLATTFHPDSTFHSGSTDLTAADQNIWPPGSMDAVNLVDAGLIDTALIVDVPANEATAIRPGLPIRVDDPTIVAQELTSAIMNLAQGTEPILARPDTMAVITLDMRSVADLGDIRIMGGIISVRTIAITGTKTGTHTKIKRSRRKRQ